MVFEGKQFSMTPELSFCVQSRTMVSTHLLAKIRPGVRPISSADIESLCYFCKQGKIFSYSQYIWFIYFYVIYRRRKQKKDLHKSHIDEAKKLGVGADAVPLIVIPAFEELDRDMKLLALQQVCRYYCSDSTSLLAMSYRWMLNLKYSFLIVRHISGQIGRAHV